MRKNGKTSIETEKLSFLIHYTEGKDEGYKEIPYIHRWTEPYRNSIIAKFLQLEDIYFEYGTDQVEHITLTNDHRGMTFSKSLKEIKKGLKDLLKVLYKHYGKQNYIWVLEPHKTGYAHVHLLYFKKLTKEEKHHLKDLWANKYGLGSYRRGLGFSKIEESKDGKIRSGYLRHVCGYLMKYISKGLKSENWSPAEWVFNATLKETHSRLWGCSRNFSEIMSREASSNYKKRSDEYQCLEVFKKDSLKPDEMDLIWSKSTGKSTDIRAVYQFCYSTCLEPNEDLLKKQKRVMQKRGDRYYIYDKKIVNMCSSEVSEVDIITEGIFKNENVNLSRKEIRKLYGYVNVGG